MSPTRRIALLGILASVLRPSLVASQVITADTVIMRIEDLQWQQCEVHGDIRQMLNLTGEARREEIQRLRQIKEELHADVERLESELDQASGDDPALGAAASLIGTSQLKE